MMENIVNFKVIEEAKKRLVKAYDPLKIYIFGSYAWGSPTKESDLDLLIVVEDSEKKSFNRPIVGYEALSGLEFSNDIIVYTKKEFEKYSQDVTQLGYKIKHEGELIYAKS